MIGSDFLKKIGLLILTFLFFVIPFLDVKASEECTSSELKRLRELASNVSFTYDYEIIEQKYTEYDEYTFKTAFYDITAFNFNNELKIRLKGYDDLLFTENEPTIGSFAEGRTVPIEIVAYTKNLCSGKVLLTKNIKLPHVNMSSFYEECKDYPDFKYCREFANYDISRDEFLKELEEYKKELDNPIFDDEDIKDFFEKYQLYIIGGIFVLTVGVIIITFVIKNRKREDL